MSLNRTTTWMAALAGVFLLALPAPGQGLQDMQVFAPAEYSSYGGGVRAKEGFFFTFDYLHWNTSAPDGVPIGYPSEGRTGYYGPDTGDGVVQTNSMSTDTFTAQWSNGERLEIGDRWDHHGWTFGSLRLKTNNDEIGADGMTMIWDDPPQGTLGRRLLQGYYLWPVGVPFPDDVPAEDIITLYGVDVSEVLPAVLRDLPVAFDDFHAENKNETWGVELMYSYRTHPQQHGGFFELFAGARYFEFNDQFSASGVNRIPGEVGDDDDDDDDTELTSFWSPNASLANSNWETSADNHIVGPQLGLRWFVTSERWTFDASGRFLAGFNSQNIFQQGTLASRWEGGGMLYTSGVDAEPVDMQGRPLLMSKTSFTHQAHASEWSPIVELRMNLQYQLTRGISVRTGWTGMWIDGIARGSALNVYRVPSMGLNLADNRQDVFIHGFNFGVLWNY